MSSEADFIRQLEAEGVDKVKAKLLARQYSPGVSTRHDFAQNWVNQKEIAQQRAKEALTEAIIARAAEAAERSAAAAEEQARQARRANRISAFALLISLASAAASGFAARAELAALWQWLKGLVLLIRGHIPI